MPDNLVNLTTGSSAALRGKVIGAVRLPETLGNQLSIAFDVNFTQGGSMSSMFNISVAAAPSLGKSILAAPAIADQPLAAPVAAAKPMPQFAVAKPLPAASDGPTIKPSATTRDAVAKPKPAPTSSHSVGVFVTGQSVATFTAASALVSLVWKVLAVVHPAFSSEKLIPLGLALIVGMLIYWQSEVPSQDIKGRVIGFSFAFLNSFTLAAAALGIDSATK